MFRMRYFKLLRLTGTLLEIHNLSMRISHNSLFKTHSSLNCQFMMEIYFLCKICIEIFTVINEQFRREILHRKAYSRFDANYARFSQGCLLAHWVCSFTRHTFVIFFGCNITVNVMLLYLATYWQKTCAISKALYVAFLSMEFGFAVFFAHIIGQVDVKAKELSDELYVEYVINRRPNEYTRIFREKVGDVSKFQN